MRAKLNSHLVQVAICGMQDHMQHDGCGSLLCWGPSSLCPSVLGCIEIQCAQQDSVPT